MQKLKELERIRKYISEKNNKNFSQPFSIHSLEEWLRLEWFKNINEKKFALSWNWILKSSIHQLKKHNREFHHFHDNIRFYKWFWSQNLQTLQKVIALQTLQKAIAYTSVFFSLAIASTVFTCRLKFMSDLVLNQLFCITLFPKPFLKILYTWVEIIVFRAYYFQWKCLSENNMSFYAFCMTGIIMKVFMNIRSLAKKIDGNFTPFNFFWLPPIN